MLIGLMQYTGKCDVARNMCDFTQYESRPCMPEQVCKKNGSKCYVIASEVSSTVGPAHCQMKPA